MEDIHVILEELCSHSSENDVLATIVHVEGSAYRKEGASMLFQEDGTQVGMLSAGCLEEDLAVRIQEHGLGKRAETVVYDMRGYNELSWGEMSGCNGVIHVFVEPVDQQRRKHLGQLKYYLDHRRSVTMIKSLTPQENQQSLFFFIEGNEVLGTKEEEVPTELKNLSEQAAMLYEKPGKRRLCMIDEDVFIQQFRPKPRLFVFGAGKDARPLVSFAARSGFSVIVADWRPALCNRTNFPDADQLIQGFPEEIFAEINITPNDHVVILTHNFQKDKELLSYLKEKPLQYLGVLGSSRRTKRLLGTRELPSHITSPIGLSIDAEGPEEIAISVVAELITFKKSQNVKRAVGS
ncbi:XdhC family protein [Halobacillus seohaensis]|uniref:XdhC family protein n=1 Tax=Halobacillus seohaensis TaxID=447421 RepID=A0ABW2ENB2_9BACI